MTKLSELTEKPKDLPPLETTKHPNMLSSVQQAWRKDGYVVLRGAIPDKLIYPYCEAWEEVNDASTGRSRWPACAYMHSKAILDLCLYPPLVKELGYLVGGTLGLHLCLTGWRSTTRDWHQDDYLNPSFVNSWYAAAWIALADIDEDSGPLELVPGSHRWPRLRRDKIIPALGLDESDPDWPAKTEEQLTPLVEQEIKDRGAKAIIHPLDKGDVLIWHGGLYHRGTVAKNPKLERRACIAHYSAVEKRTDMKDWRQHGGFGWYFNCEQPLTEGRLAP